MNQFILRDQARYEQTKINHGFSKGVFFSNNYSRPVPGSEIVGSATLRKRKHEKKNKKKNEGPTFRVPLTFASSPLSENVEEAK